MQRAPNTPAIKIRAFLPGGSRASLQAGSLSDLTLISLQHLVGWTWKQLDAVSHPVDFLDPYVTEENKLGFVPSDWKPEILWCESKEIRCL